MIGIWTVLAILFICFECHYFWRVILLATVCLIRRRFRKKGLLEENILYGICTTTDLDTFGHMNNGRYSRECDFARFELLMENFAFRAIKKLGGSVALGATTFRFRKSIKLFDIYRIRSKVVCWDERSFYVEQRFERRRDDFICAVAFIKLVLTGATPAQVVRELNGQDMSSPTAPLEIQKWIECNEISSEKLRKDK